MSAWFTPATLRPWLEIAYFVATVVMGVASTFVVVQVWLARAALLQAQKDLRVRTTRESIALAAELCEKFGGDFLRLRKEQTKIADATGIRMLSWPLVDASFTGTSIAPIARQPAEAWAESVDKNPEAQFALVLVVNALEAFAMPFATGVADESVAFNVIGNPFLDEMAAFAPMLIRMREKRALNMSYGAFANSVRLYELWSVRRDEMRLAAGMKKYADEMASLKKPNPITPIGTG